MAWTPANPVAVGDPTKKKNYDSLWDNTDLLADFIKGDNAEGSGQAGHQHGGSSSLILGSSAVGSTDVIQSNVIGTTHMRASSITQVELKSSTVVATNGTSSWVDTAIGVGTYGFYPQIKNSASGTTGKAKIADNTNNTSYATTIALLSSAGGGLTISAKMRYVQASGPLFWFFILRNSITKEIISMVTGDDHPCYGNGGNPDLIPHPFIHCFDETTDEWIAQGHPNGIKTRYPNHEVVVIILDKNEIKKLRKDVKDGGYDSVIDLFQAEYEIDDSGEEPWPDTVDVSVDIDVNENDKKTVKKMKIPKPNKVKHYKLKKL